MLFTILCLFFLTAKIDKIDNNLCRLIVFPIPKTAKCEIFKLFEGLSDFDPFRFAIVKNTKRKK